MSEIKIRHAIADDRPHFLRLWRAMLVEIEGYGSDIAVLDANLEMYLAHFVAYCEGSGFGAVLLWDGPQGVPEGVAMAGEQIGTSFPTVSKHGRLAEGWGGYVSPPYRKQGVLSTLQTAIGRAVGRMGFDAMVTHVHPGNDVSSAFAAATGWQKVSTCYVYRFGEEGS